MQANRGERAAITATAVAQTACTSIALLSLNQQSTSASLLMRIKGKAKRKQLQR